MNAKTRIRDYVTKGIAGDIGDDDDIFELGVVSSLFAMQLVHFIEREFSITVEREDLNIDNFSSVAAMTKFVVKKIGGAGSGGEDGHPPD
jgi:methoxymalonate biosynthesis acyl carrier protein